MERERRAVLHMAREEALKDGRTRRNNRDIARMSNFLRRIRENSHEVARRIVKDELERRELRREAGDELYELWNTTLQKIIGQMSKQFRQAIRGRRLAIASAQTNSTGQMSDEDKPKLRGIVSKINIDLVAQIIDRMLCDWNIRRGFYGKDKLLNKFVEYTKAQAPSLTEQAFRDGLRSSSIAHV